MLSPETKEFIKEHKNEDPRALALQGKRYPSVDIREAVTQIEGWQAAKEKLPTWAETDGIIYPPRISMEQCSSEPTALYKAAIAKGDRLADLTGGFGIDCSYMSRGFREATYIERNAVLCDIARENFALLGLGNINIIKGNSEELLHTLPKQDWIFIDPARRALDGRKVVALSDCEPDVTALESQLLEKTDKVMVKCSPMLDITAATRLLSSIETVHIIAVNNECKELLFILGEGKCEETPIRCVNIRKEELQVFTFTVAEEANAEVTHSNTIGRYLYEPNAAILKGGCYRTLSQRLLINKLHPNSQLYTSDKLVGEFPGRIFEVERVFGFSKADIKQLQNLKKANMTVRNFPESVQALRKKLRLAEGGDKYLFATTLYNGAKALVLCRRCNASK